MRHTSHQMGKLLGRMRTATIVQVKNIFQSCCFFVCLFVFKYVPMILPFEPLGHNKTKKNPLVFPVISVFYNAAKILSVFYYAVLSFVFSVDFTEGSQTEAANHASTENEPPNPSQSMIPNTDAQFQESPASLSSEEQAPMTVAPVPLYPTQQPMTLPPVFPMETFGPPPVSIDQSHANLDSSSKHDNFHSHTAASTLPPKSYSNTG